MHESRWFEIWSDLQPNVGHSLVCEGKHNLETPHIYFAFQILVDYRDSKWI